MAAERTFGMLVAFMWAVRRHSNKKAVMKKWRTPRVVEISCGCEINAYFPAEL